MILADGELENHRLHCRIKSPKYYPIQQRLYPRKVSIAPKLIFNPKLSATHYMFQVYSEC
jgi:hypothetical protein